jgi:hypothetical protein
MKVKTGEIKHGEYIPFSSVEKYALNPQYSGCGETPGAKWHPNYRGHVGYANELIKCFDENYFAKNPK